MLGRYCLSRGCCGPGTDCPEKVGRSIPGAVQGQVGQQVGGKAGWSQMIFKVPCNLSHSIILRVFFLARYQLLSYFGLLSQAVFPSVQIMDSSFQFKSSFFGLFILPQKEFLGPVGYLHHDNSMYFSLLEKSSQPNIYLASLASFC